MFQVDAGSRRTPDGHPGSHGVGRGHEGERGHQDLVAGSHPEPAAGPRWSAAVPLDRATAWSDARPGRPTRARRRRRAVRGGRSSWSRRRRGASGAPRPRPRVGTGRCGSCARLLVGGQCAGGQAPASHQDGRRRRRRRPPAPGSRRARRRPRRPADRPRPSRCRRGWRPGTGPAPADEPVVGMTPVPGHEGRRPRSRRTTAKASSAAGSATRASAATPTAGPRRGAQAAATARPGRARGGRRRRRPGRPGPAAG